MKRKLLAIIFMTCAFTAVRAQFDVHFTHYWNMLNFYNPAGAGAADHMLMYAAYSNQLTGFKNNPKSMLLNIDTPIPFVKGKHNAGLGVLNDEIGLFTNQHLYMNYAYGIGIFKGTLTAGIQIGLLNCTFNNKGINFGGDSNDPAFPSGNADGNTFDIGAGMLYRNRHFYAGISGLHLNAPLVLMGEKNEIQVDPYFNFTAGGNIPIKNTLITIQPSLQVMTDLVAWRTDITARGTYSYNERDFFGGITYSPGTAVALFLGVEMMNITVSYGYDMYISGIGAKNGSHDIYIGYKIDLDIFKKEKNKHNSIRVLQ